MADVLGSPELYTHIGGEPPTEAELSVRYTRQTAGVSPDSSQEWMNWVVMADGTTPAGYVQASRPIGATTAEVAWVIGVAWQGRGYATTTVTLMVAGLAARGVDEVVVDIRPANNASEGVARHIGMAATGPGGGRRGPVDRAHSGLGARGQLLTPGPPEGVHPTPKQRIHGVERVRPVPKRQRPLISSMRITSAPMVATPDRIHVTFDVRTDAGGKDPDSHSPTLREYHRLLWSKELPSGRHTEFDTHTPGAYLHHSSDLGRFVLASDIISPCPCHIAPAWLRSSSSSIRCGSPDSRQSAEPSAGHLVFPGNRIDGKITINEARGSIL